MKLTKAEIEAAEEMREFLRTEITAHGRQVVVPGTPGRVVPQVKLRAKVEQTEAPLALELPEIERKEPKLF